MIRPFVKATSLCLAFVLALGSLAGCQQTPADTTGTTAPAPIEEKDYAGSVKLDMSSSTKKLEVTVKTYVDGDTVHFDVPESEMVGGVLKARFLAVNTPESTGKIEEYGKTASNFTKETLQKATSIIIESDTDKWDADSTGGRYLVWVWYKTEGMADYRNLNIEILQKGLAIASNSGNNIYGDTALAAIAQARALKLNVYSGKKDPNFFYGEAYEVDLKELRLNAAKYEGAKVAFEGIIALESNNTVYVERYDPETDMYYGMTVYYGFGMDGFALEILSVGNEVRIVGTVSAYNGNWQVSGLSYNVMKPQDPNNIQCISKGHSGCYRLTAAELFAKGTLEVTVDEEVKTVPYAQMAMSTTLSMEGLQVVDVYTTDKEESSSKGAMTLTCKVGDVTISVRTAVLLDEQGNLITADAYMGKTIDVRGIVDCFDGEYQIKVFSAKNIIVKD